MSRKKQPKPKATAVDLLMAVMFGTRMAGYRRGGSLKLRKCHKSRHGCRRYDQLERMRKRRRKGPRPAYYRHVELCERCEAAPKQYGGDYCVACDARLDHGPVSRALARSRA